MAKTTYVWDELSDNVIEEYEDGVLSVSYDHEPGLYGNLLSQNRNGVTSYYHYDGRGDTVALTDDSGNVTDTKEYDAWGNVIASTGSTVTPYQFGGRQGYQTGNTGVYIWARMYQPTIARWSSVDPLLPKNLETPFVFVYVKNSPVWLMDPSGLIEDKYPWYVDPNILNKPPFLPVMEDPPFPRLRLPLEPFPQDPEIDQNCFIANCNAYTVSEWGEDLCNFEKRPGDRPCPCHTMKDAGQPLTDGEIKQLFEDARSRIAMLNIDGLCTVELAIRDKCSTRPGFGGFAVTCPGISGKNPKICFPKTISRCDAAGLMAHEMLHALQACQGRAGKPFPGETNPLEKEAYRINCTAQQIHDCIPPGPLRNSLIEACILKGATQSTGGSGGGAFEEICKELQGNGGGW